MLISYNRPINEIMIARDFEAHKISLYQMNEILHLIPITVALFGKSALNDTNFMYSALADIIELRYVNITGFRSTASQNETKNCYIN